MDYIVSQVGRWLAVVIMAIAPAPSIRNGHHQALKQRVCVSAA